MHSTVTATGDGPKREAKFSLYSTDSEDQVISAHRGLDRCAALLKSLLSPESKSPEKQEHSRGAGRKGAARKQVQAKTSGKHSSRNKKDFPNPQTTLPKPRFPGASKYLQPEASSTPTVKHSRSKTEPRKSSKQGDTHSVTVAGHDQGSARQSGRKYPTVRHKRVRTEPHVIVCGSANVDEAPHKSTGDVPFTGTKQAAAPCSNKNQPQAPTRGKPISTATNSELFLPPHHYPYTMPSFYHPYPYAYHPHFWPPFTGQFSLPLHPQQCSPSLRHVPHSTQNPLQSFSYPLLSQQSPQTNKKPSPFVSRRVISRTSPHQRQTTPLTPGHINPVVSTSRSGNTPSHPSSKSGPQLLQSFAQEMFHSFQQSLGRIRESVGAGNSDLLTELESMGCSQRQYHDQLSMLFKQVIARPDVADCTPSSTADWLAQVHQLELEKSHLLERVIQSEMACSDTKRQLDQEKRQVEDLRSKLETTSSQLYSMKNEFQGMAEALSVERNQKKAMEEDLEKAKTSFTQSERLLNIKNTALQQQVNSLEEQFFKSKEETVRGEDQLSNVKCSLETAQEEIQMIKVSLMEKETELLQAQDQLLGLRQCLAYFLSETVHLDAAQVSQSHYCIPEEAIQRFQSLVTDGNINSFLAAYTERISEDDPLDTTLQNSLQTSPARSLSSASLSPKYPPNDCGSGMDVSLEYLGIHPEGSRTSLQRKRSSQVRPVGSNASPISSRSNVTGVDQQSAITTSSEVEFQKDLACLDADIARLQIQFRVIMQAPH